jgi:hypothetical protein
MYGNQEISAHHPKFQSWLTNYLCQHYKVFYSTPSTVYKHLPELKSQIITKICKNNDGSALLFCPQTVHFVTQCVISVFKNTIKNKITHQVKKERIMLML